jgi:hypothetical protein
MRQCRTTIADEVAAATASLQSEREATSAQINQAGAIREDLRLWLKEQQDLCVKQARTNLEELAAKQSEYVDQLRRELDQCTRDLGAKSAAIAEENIRADVEGAVRRAEAALDQRLGPTLDRAGRFSQELLTLMNNLRAESERHEAQVRALTQERERIEVLITQRSADFQKTFHDALVETTGHIKGRLQLAVEMIEQPVEKLRVAAATELQEEAGRQATEIRKCWDEAAERLQELRRAIETSVRDSLRAQAAETCSVAGRQMAQMAQSAVEEWLAALAKNLEAIRGTLSQKFPGNEADPPGPAPTPENDR